MAFTELRRAVRAVAPVLACLASPALAGFDYVATVETVPGAGGAEAARGVAFHDLNRDGRRQPGEAGIAGVIVSNGLDVVTTGPDGAYALPVRGDMTVMASRPSGWQVPVSPDGAPQFFYTHKPAGSPGAMRFGGLKPTGPLPAAINFPMVPDATGEEFSCVAMGDTQPYSNDELGYVRDGVVASLLARDDLGEAACMLVLGDLVGDDLGLLPRLSNTLSVLGLSQHYVHGNHDYDHDAARDADSSDTWRRLYGPNYYSFEIGRVFFAVLDNVVYPCSLLDAAPDDRASCGDGQGRAHYNGRVTGEQMAWLEATLEHVPRDRLVVLMTHIPLVSASNRLSGRHQTDNAAELHALLAGRPALSLAGHTHTFEYLAAGEEFEGWQERVGVGKLPFDHVIGGAPSGSWFQGDMNFDGVPMAFASDGTPPGYMMIEFEGAEYRISFHAANQPAERQMALSFSTPGFRDWLGAALESGVKLEGAAALPAVSVADLGDLRLFTPGDLGEGVWLTANVWGGARDTAVTVSIDGGSPLEASRSQEGAGEAMQRGEAFADPFAVARQITIGRFAWASTSDEPRAQGFESFRGERHGPAVPQSVGPAHLALGSTHLWRFRMPEALGFGAHVAEVRAVDRHGRVSVERIAFEVRDARPPRFWRSELWPAY
jgi:hypothetical protein